MRRIGAGLVTAGVVAMVFCLLTACVVSHDCGAPPAHPPGDQSPVVPVNVETENACVGVPTLAPPRDELAVSSNLRVAKHPLGQVVFIQVEVDAAGDSP